MGTCTTHIQREHISSNTWTYMDAKTLLVIGYIRQIKRAAFVKCIGDLCLCYYQTKWGDEWDETAKGNNIKINPYDSRTISYRKPGYGYSFTQSAYLSNVVSTGVHIWKIRIDRIGQHVWNEIGIWNTSSGQPIVNGMFTSHKNGILLIIIVTIHKNIYFA